MGLGELPPEIILIILDCIGVTETLGICLLSKKFRALAQPQLYHDIVLGPEDIRSSLPLLCRTVTTCPFIAQQVRCLDIDTDLFLDQDTGRYELPAKDIQPLELQSQNLVKGMNMPDSSAFETEAILPMLLIARSPNLRQLTITLDPQGLGLFTSLAQVRNSTPTSLFCRDGVFESLSVDCRQDSHGGDININSIARLLSLLRLTSIQVNDYSLRGQQQCNTIYPVSLPLGLPSLSTVSLSRSHIGESGIGMLLCSCRDLESFYCGQEDLQSNQLSPRQLYSLLSSHRDSLRILQLSSLDDSIPDSAALPMAESEFGSLTDFVGLEYLTLDQVYLGKAPQLPVYLKHLAVQNCQSPIAPLLVYIAGLALDSKLPRLASISLHTDTFYPGQMLGLPHRGATDILFDKACLDLLSSLSGTGIALKLEGNLLEKTVEGYDAAFECGDPGAFWPFMYLK
ncbi:hypothetical protein ASPVEDRAFT_591069 [Aspergillus versicolor CBS 583.65]|uniref:F-box domain-containing protein n=1 Tax=Aspergillus versicolor CBS 583.65 TaxID=1036611 RepID=A0A1L9PH93_ASPVE|nr:uncharacterized protein ASPVEDRAFT_591069 [Aspergillus versicolor CBS 583.65]OJJ00833.1 hypothetical protein ASPVEDRAFT_591069 [Aspergillus versicolor CBS 583.65]